jgi:hypothetical protein
VILDLGTLSFVAISLARLLVCSNFSARGGWKWRGCRVICWLRPGRVDQKQFRDDVTVALKSMSRRWLNSDRGTQEVIMHPMTARLITSEGRISPPLV